MSDCSRLFPSVPGTGGTQCSRVPRPYRGNRERVQCSGQRECSRPEGPPEPRSLGLDADGGGIDRARLGRRSRRKGKTWERELAALLRPVFGERVKRGFQSRCGRDGCDVEGTPFWLEAKHGKLVNVRAALKQALEATDGRPAVVVAKDDRSAPLVVMRLEDWLSLVAAVSRSEQAAGAIKAPGAEGTAS